MPKEENADDLKERIRQLEEQIKVEKALNDALRGK